MNHDGGELSFKGDGRERSFKRKLRLTSMLVGGIFLFVNPEMVSVLWTSWS